MKDVLILCWLALVGLWDALRVAGGMAVLLGVVLVFTDLSAWVVRVWALLTFILCLYAFFYKMSLYWWHGE